MAHQAIVFASDAGSLFVCVYYPVTARFADPLLLAFEFSNVKLLCP